MVVRFDDNACALIGKNGEPLGTRINGESDLGIPAVYTTSERRCDTYAYDSFGIRKCSVICVRCYTDVHVGVVGSELREKQWSKILSLASAHV